MHSLHHLICHSAVSKLCRTPPETTVLRLKQAGFVTGKQSQVIDLYRYTLSHSFAAKDAGGYVGSATKNATLDIGVFGVLVFGNSLAKFGKSLSTFNPQYKYL